MEKLAQDTAPETARQMSAQEQVSDSGVFGNTKGRLAVLAIGAIGALGSSEAASDMAEGKVRMGLDPAVEASSVDQDKNNQPETSPSKTTFRQYCVRAGLTRPDIFATRVVKAGKYARQINLTGIQFQAMPEPCYDYYERKATGRFQAKRASDRRWRNLHYPQNIQYANKGQESGIVENAGFHDKPNSDIYLRRGERARVLITSKILNAKDKVIGVKRFAKPAKIYKGNSPY